MYFPESVMKAMTYLTDEQAGRITKAVYAYSSKGEVTSFEESILCMVYSVARQDIDEEVARHRRGPKKGCCNNPTGKNGKEVNSGLINQNKKQGTDNKEVTKEVKNEELTTTPLMVQGSSSDSISYSLTPKEKINININPKEKVERDYVAEEFKESFELWLKYKRERKQTYKPVGEKMCYKKLVELSGNNPSKAKEIVEFSISNNYQGLFAPRQQVQTTKSNNPLNVNDRWNNF